MNRYTDICREVARLAESCGRDPAEVHVIAVSKRQPADAVKAVYADGCRDVGENRVQEALGKISECPTDLRWHLIGSLQANKVRKVVGRFACIHSVHDFSLAEHLSICSGEAGVVTSLLLQVNTSGEATKQGLSIDMWREQMDAVRQLPHLSIQGLMTMAPQGADEAVIRACFSRLRLLKEELGLYHLSMGMSEDYPIAIQEGATLLRIGSAIFSA